MKDKLIIKRITDKYWEIMDRHGDSKWAVDELEYLIYDVFKEEYAELNEDEKYEVDHCMEVLKED